MLDVSAHATVQRAPDMAVVRLAVETVAGTAREAIAENAETMTAVTEALRQLGIDEADLRTESIDLSPRYRRGPDVEEPTITGYHAANRMAVRVRGVERVGPVVDAAIAAGANRLAGIRFQLSDHESAYLEAVRLATERARREAQVLAEAAGAALGPILRVSTGERAPIPTPRAEVMALRADAATPVQPGELEVGATVRLTYRLDRGR